MLLLAGLACDSTGSAVAPVEAPAPPPIAAPVAKGPDVVLITLDTTRADRLGAYGHALARTDAIDALAAKGLRFDHAYSVLPLTIPAHATLFTGLFPFHTDVRDNGAAVLQERFTTLAERFHDAGYATAGSAAAFVTTRQWGFAQGFDAYFDEMPAKVDQARSAQNFWHSERPGELVVSDALAWLATVPAEKPVFLWVHLYDAHLPYQPPPAYAALTPGRPYDGELAYVDDQVARVVEAFAGRDTIFALVGDHGESLGEHREVEHGMYTYDATQRVPWILSGAGVKPGVVAEPVSSADVAPTLLSLAGLAVPEGLDGKVQPGSATHPYAESYQLVDRLRLAPHRMIVDGSLKLILKPKPELYDVVADPGERTNLAATRPDDVKRLSGLLEALDATPPTKGAALDAATIAQLESLGYVAGSTGSIDPFSLPDPLDYPELLAGLNELDRDRGPRDNDVTIKKLTALLALKPDAYELRMRKANLLTRAGKAEEARAFMEETSRLFPDDARPFSQLSAITLADDPARALVFAGRALDIDPRDRIAREVTVAAQLSTGLEEDGVAAGTAWLEDDPGNVAIAAALGRYWMIRGDLARAEQFLRTAVECANPTPGARIQLATLVAGTGRRAEAITLLDAELGDNPRSAKALAVLSRVYSEERDYQSQLDVAQRLVELEPENARARLDLAQCQFNMRDYAVARTTLEVAKRLDPAEPDIMLLDANLLDKEGKSEEGRALFLKADALHRARTGDAAAPGASAVRPKAKGDGNVLARPAVKP